MKIIVKRLFALAMCLSLLVCAPALASTDYTATAHGHHSDVTVSVTLSDDAIESVKVIEEGETFNLSDAAISAVPAAIVDNQSVKVDTVAGATFTSYAILSAVTDCLKQAGGDELVARYSVDVPKQEPSTEEHTVEADVIVVGSGAAGMAAALNAQKAGARVVVLEKLDFYGGISQTIFGGLLLPLENEAETHAFMDYTVKKAAGFMNNEEALVNDLYPDRAQIEAFIAHTPEMLSWLDEEGISRTPLGERVVDGGYALGSVLITYDNAPDNVGHMFTAFVDSFTAKGGEMYMGTCANSLIVTDGKVTGVKATSKAGSYTFVGKSVVLATGGFGASVDMLKTYAPAYADDMNMTLSSNTGEGMLMALDAGAVMYDDQTVMSGFGHLELTDADMISPYMDSLTSKASLFVSPAGLRLNSEDPYSYTLGTVFANPDGRDYYWVINNRQVAEDGGYLELLEQRVAEGNSRFFKADDIATLARQIKITPNTLRYTLNHYNDLCAKGEDVDFHKAPEYLVAMEEGPWYAVKAEITNFGTVGGIVTNENAEVTDANGAAIPGLYAAGEISNHGFEHLCYAQNQFGICLVMGMLAGQNAAR